MDMDTPPPAAAEIMSREEYLAWHATLPPAFQTMADEWSVMDEGRPCLRCKGSGWVTHHDSREPCPVCDGDGMDESPEAWERLRANIRQNIEREMACEAANRAEWGEA